MRRVINSAMRNIDKHKFKDIGTCFSLTLDIHVKHCHWCTKGWLKYIESLEKDVEVSNGPFLIHRMCSYGVLEL